MPLKLRVQGILVAAILLAALAGAMAQTTANRIFAARAQTAFELAQKNYLADTNSAAACALARTSFDLADFATNAAQRAEIARRGIAVCRQWLAHEPKAAAGHYYLAMNLGELAQAEAPSIAAYKLVHEVEREFKLAAELDVRFDHAGPARNLGELYFQAPGWPFSVGSRRKAREWLERAAALAPGDPENQLNLAEAQLKWHQHEALETTMKNLAAIWPAAKTNFTGAAWEQSWLDWSVRRAALQTEFQKVFKRAP
jgi:tetratricopeptide (TPR) repeat protein